MTQRQDFPINSSPNLAQLLQYLSGPCIALTVELNVGKNEQARLHFGLHFERDLFKIKLKNVLKICKVKKNSPENSRRYVLLTFSSHSKFLTYRLTIFLSMLWKNDISGDTSIQLFSSRLFVAFSLNLINAEKLQNPTWLCLELITNIDFPTRRVPVLFQLNAWAEQFVKLFFSCFRKLNLKVCVDSVFSLKTFDGVQRFMLPEDRTKKKLFLTLLSFQNDLQHFRRSMWETLNYLSVSFAGSEISFVGVRRPIPMKKRGKKYWVCKTLHAVSFILLPAAGSTSTDVNIFLT